MVVLNVCFSKLWTEQENRYSQHKLRCDVVKKILKKFIKTVATHGHTTSDGNIQHCTWILRPMDGTPNKEEGFRLREPGASGRKSDRKKTDSRYQSKQEKGSMVDLMHAGAAPPPELFSGLIL
jgi:hypothetical protein